MSTAGLEILTSSYLPQVGVASPSKRSLVIYPYSDSESSTNDSNSVSSGGRCKKLKPNLLNSAKWNGQNDSLEIMNCIVAPSSEKMLRRDPTIVLSQVRRKENFIQHSQKDFWESIRNNYAYLMDDYLITTCKQTNEELLRINPDFSSSSRNSPSWTCTQFIQRFNELHDALHSLQAIATEQSDKNAFLQNAADKLQEITKDCQLLKDQALLLEIRYPEMKDDIWRRCNILNNKWETLELTLWPKRKHEREGLLQKVTGKMKDIRRWLREVDQKLENLDAKENWTKEHIAEVVKSQHVVQQEIETRGREVTSLVKDCQSLEGAAAAETLKRVRRVASNLERSWHTTWLRSLEIQCLTQQVLQDKQLHYTKDQNESDVDEGPLTKHRRLTSDFSPLTLKMDSKNSKDSSSRDGSKDVNSRTTREIGILCSVTKDLVSVNDKCIMVGTTGIAALKAKYGDDFTNFEIIQDVGYSSESSTHLSSDDVSDHIRIYSYSPAKRSHNCDVNSNTSLSKGTDYSAISNSKLFGHSSLGSNSSHNDSGFGALETVADAGEISPEGLDEQYLSSSPGANGDYYAESDLLDSVDFPNISEFETEHTDYGLDGMESSDSLDNFQNRSSFTSSTRAFYKMTSVDSDYGDKVPQEKDSTKTYPNSSSEDELGAERTEAHTDSNLFDRGTMPKSISGQNSSVSASENGHVLMNISITASNSDNELRSNDDRSSEHNIPNTDISSLSDIECLPVTPSKTSSDPQDSDVSEDFLLRRRFASHLCSTPCAHHSICHQKPQSKNYRKGRRRRLSFDESRDSNSNNWDNLLCSCSKNKSARSNRVREWLKRCSDGKSTSSAHHNTPAVPFRDDSASDDHHHPSPPVAIETAVDSSCDASGEYTTTESDDESADYQIRTGSMMGSVETVVPLNITCFPEIHFTGSHDGVLPELLPPPPPPTPPTSSEENPVSSTYSYQMRKDGSFGKPMRSISEGDLCSSGLKNSGMKQLNEPRNALPVTKSSVNPEFIVPCVSTIRQNSESRRNTRMWRRSLPIVLYSEFGHSGSDVPSQGLKSSGTLTSLGYSSDISHWQKSLSGSGRRSRKRSSSSSKCSSTRSSNIANRNHHRGSRTTISASRGRHLSQSSGSQIKETLFAFEENTFVKVTDDDIPQSISCHVDEDRSCIRRSPENDVILTQYEEQSTASDQVWDGYQEMPYLSEAYSEPTVDEDAVRKLTEFGDDYCSAIGSQPHGLGSSNRKRAEASAFPTEPLTYFAKTTICPPTSKSSNNPVDSDSDIEDLHDILTETCRALQFARNTLNCRREGKVLSQAENAELLATCQTHLRCLEVICEHIEIDGKEKNFSREDLVRLHDLIEEWAELQRIVVMNQQEVQNCEEKVLKAQKNIDDLYTKMTELSCMNHLNPKDISSLDDLQQKMEAIQMALSTLQETKEQLLAVNIQVHRIVTESGDTSSPLKQRITELYQQWEDAYEENGNELTDLQLLFNRWQMYEKNYQKLLSRLREEQKRVQQSSCDTKLLQSDEEEDDTSLEDELNELQIEAEFLECRLRGGVVLSVISSDLRRLHTEILQLKRRQRHQSESGVQQLRTSIAKSQSVHHSRAASDEELMDELDAHQKALEDSKLKSEDDVPELPLEARDQEKPTTGSHSRLWRVLRAALPIQLALVFLYCLACALEPHCCDLLNNFNFSFSPQLRYVRGPPPI